MYIGTGEVRSMRTEPVDNGRSHRARPERAEERYDSKFPPPLPGRIHLLHGYPRVPSRYAGTILRLFEALNLVAETVTHPDVGVEACRN